MPVDPFTVPGSHDCTWESELRRAVVHQLEVEESIREFVTHARDEHSATWATIAGVLGVTRQAARQRFGAS